MRPLLKTGEMKSIEFIYKGKTYYALIRTTVFEIHCHHYTTIMNGKLEALFYGHHLFIEQKGDIKPMSHTNDAEINELKKCIREAMLRQVLTDNYNKCKNVEKYSRNEHQKAVA